MRRRAVALALVAGAAAPGAVAWAAFGGGVSAGAASLATWTVPAPANLRCQGLTSLTSSRIAWDAVAPPGGQTVDYVVTLPGGRTTTTSQTFHTLPVVTLPGQYAVQAQIASGWLSQPVTITVTLTALGLLYLCATP
jgi:hypothetical protein